MVSAWAPGPPSKPSSSNSADGVQLTWSPPLSSGGDPVRCYTVWGRTGGEQGEYVVLRAHIPVAECGGVESPCITVAYAVLPNPSGWWEFGVQAVNSSAQGPRSPPSLPLMVTLPAGSPVKEAPPPTDDTRTRWNSAPAATSSTLPVAPSLGPLTPGSPAAANPALDLLGGVVGTAVATIAKLFSMGAKEARQRSDGFGATPVPQRRASWCPTVWRRRRAAHKRLHRIFGARGQLPARRVALAGRPHAITAAEDARGAVGCGRRERALPLAPDE